MEHMLLILSLIIMLLLITTIIILRIIYVILLDIKDYIFQLLVKIEDLDKNINILILDNKGINNIITYIRNRLINIEHNVSKVSNSIENLAIYGSKKIKQTNSTSNLKNVHKKPKTAKK